MRCLSFVVAFCVSMPVLAQEPADLSLLIQPNAFETLVNPECSHCRIEAQRRAKELRSDDRVLCWIRGYSDGGAIPLRFFLNKYRVISDSYGVFVYDPDAGFARGFAPSFDFTFHGWRNGVMVIRHKDGTLYSSLSGKAFEGPNAGTKLEPVPTLVSRWRDWLERYPDTVAYTMFDRYQPKELPNDELTMSRQTSGPLDPRLAADEAVLGVTNGQHARAYSVKDLANRGMIHDRIDGQDRVILWNGPTETAAAYLSVAHSPHDKQSARPVTLRLEGPNSSAPFVDRDTASHWDITGRAIDGELKGWVLQWLDSTQVKWFAWAAEYPKTSIYHPAE